ncbi:bicyclomycin resistance protein [Escherichia coli]|uniref:Bicyclomycin resistance protein n=1 Tax=Escherichia coli TaxID=562 RepID=A0A376KSH1_ECOLX|nr:bicyclomycin resistance protein [Escherichia coli]
MTTRQHSSFAIVFILGLLAMLMPLSIDMYLPALPVISAQFGVPAGSTQMTLSTYILGFALGQLIYGPMADSFGRKPVVLGGTLVFCRRRGGVCVGKHHRSADCDAFSSTGWLRLRPAWSLTP